MLGALDREPVDGVVVDHVRDAGEGPAAQHRPNVSNHVNKRLKKQLKFFRFLAKSNVIL